MRRPIPAEIPATCLLLPSTQETCAASPNQCPQATGGSLMPVTTVQPLAAAMQPTWTKIRDVLAGESAVKAKDEDYLPRLPGQRKVAVAAEWIDLYDGYLARAVLLPFAGPLLARLTGMVFRKAPVFTVPAAIEPQLDNIALMAPAITAEGLAKITLRECITTGWGCLTVNWDELQRRPYQRHYLADNVVSWREELVAGQPQPTQIVLREYLDAIDSDDPFVLEAEEQYRVFQLVDGLAQVTLWRRPTEGADFVPDA